MDSPIFFFLFSFFLLLSSTSCSNLCNDPPSTSGSTDLSIFHVHSKCSPFFTTPTHPPTELDTVLNSATKDPARVTYLSSLLVQKPATKVPVASGQQIFQTNNYVLRAKFGTPGQLLFLALDTGSDSAWVPCSGCSGCPTSTAAFSPRSSSTYKTVGCSSSFCPRFKGLACNADVASPCAFNQTYGGDSSFSGTLSMDSLRLALDIVPNYPFGCVNSVAGGSTMPKQGLLGFGRGDIGFLARTQSVYQGVFSYCLPSFKSYYFSGSLRLGPLGQPKAIRTTPLLRNPHRPSLYYLNLLRISIGKTTVHTPPGSFDFNPNTGAGTVIDSGTVITRFVAPAYKAIRDEFRHQVNAANYSSLGAFDTCFATDSKGPVTPMFTLHFEGMDLVLPVENTLIHSSARPLACLAMAAAPDNVNAVVNVIANLQQQNFRVVFDVANSKVGFARESCN